MSEASDIFLAAGVTGVDEDDVVDTLGLAPNSWLSVISDCLCSGTGGEDDLDDFRRSGVSLVTVETLLMAGSRDDNLRSPGGGDLVLSPIGDNLRSDVSVLGDGVLVLS